MAFFSVFSWRRETPISYHSAEKNLLSQERDKKCVYRISAVTSELCGCGDADWKHICWGDGQETAEAAKTASPHD